MWTTFIVITWEVKYVKNVKAKELVLMRQILKLNSLVKFSDIS